MKTLTVKQLRRWVSDQQRAHRRGQLQQRTQSELNEFGTLFGWGESRPPIDFLSLTEAQALCVRENIRAQAAYTVYRASHKGCRLPSEPDVTYGISLCKFFDTERSWLTLRQAQTLCRREGLTCTGKTSEYRKTHEDCGLAANPPRYYGLTQRGFFGADERPKREVLRLIRLAKEHGGMLPTRASGLWYKPHAKKQPKLHRLFLHRFKRIGTAKRAKWVLR